jgi:hypothetical protein
MKYYIGIDPDLRKLNAAILTEEKKPLAVLLRRNNDNDIAIVGAARMACRLVEDVIAFLTAEILITDKDSIITVVEDQNVQYTGHTNTARKQDVLHVAQVAGCLLGAFSNMSDRMYIVQPGTWKGQVPKEIHHRRIYRELSIATDAKKLAKNMYPETVHEGYLIKWSHDKINPGDFSDINDSLGLALYGAVKGL